MTSQFADMRSSLNSFEVAVFWLSSVVTGPNFMSTSLLVLELWQFSILRTWPELRKSEMLPSEFCPVSRDWGDLGISNLARMSPMKCYYCGYSFCRFWVIKGKPTHYPITQIRVNKIQGKLVLRPFSSKFLSFCGKMIFDHCRSFSPCRLQVLIAKL